MYKSLFALVLISTFSGQAFAKTHSVNDEIASTTITEITETENAIVKGKPASPEVPVATAPGASEQAPGETPKSGGLLSQVTLDQLITLGESIWHYVLESKPDAQIQTLSSSVVPDGITDWVQLSGWQAPVSKVYHVVFKNSFGGTSASFDYRISYIAGGNYNGHGKFLGQISFTPMNIKLNTGRSLDVKVDLSKPLNFGTQADPVAGVQLTVSWTTPTLTKYQMQSAEYFITGNGDIQDMSNGTASN